MISRFLLIRHAPHAEMNRILTGRSTGISLDAHGRREAARLADRLSHQAIDALFTSPRERARETAEAIAAKHASLHVQVSDALDEVEFGRWAGVSFDALQADPLWRRWNEARSTVRAPGGETMAEVQARALRLIGSLADSSPGSTIALVTHAEVVRAVACHALGLSLDEWHRIEVAPASVSRLSVADGSLRFEASRPGPD